MIKRNGDNKIEFDAVATANVGIRLVVYIIIGLAVYFNTIGDIKTRQAVITERQRGIIDRLDGVDDVLGSMATMSGKLDSLIIELRHLR